MMSADSVKYLVLHCSATRRNQDYSAEQMRRDHKKRGFYDIGYHLYIRKDGTMTQHRFLLEVGAHARPYNRCSIGICYEGGLGENGKPCNTLTPEQTLASMMCWHDFTSFSRRRRLWGIVTCLVLPRRNVLVLTLTLSLVGLRIKHLYITYFSSVTSSRYARLISIVAPLTYRISLPMRAFVPARRCTYASNPFSLPWVILTFCPFFKGPV